MADEAGDDESGNALVNGSTLPPGRRHRGLAMFGEAPSHAHAPSVQRPPPTGSLARP